MDVQGLARDRVSRGAADATVVRALHLAVRHGRAQQHLLPTAATDDRRWMGRSGATGLSVRAQARCVRVTPDEAARRRELAAQPHRPRRTPRSRARPDARAASTAMEA